MRLALVRDLLSDLRLGARGLLRSPGFAALAVGTLALGLGANTATFAVVDAVALRPLPWPEADRLVMIWGRSRDFGHTWINPYEAVSFARRCPSLEGTGYWTTSARTLSGDGEAQRVAVAAVSAGAFHALGVGPALGRAFTAEEERAGGPALAILTDALWRGRYGADPGVVGRALLLDRVPHTVVGVMPRGFALPTDLGEEAAEPARVLVPRAVEAEELAGTADGHSDYGVGRLADGATVERLNTELAAVAAAFVAEGRVPAEEGFRPFARALDDEVLGPYRPALLLVAGAVGLLALVSCANVANVLLARAVRRQREIALRAVLGAGRGRLLRQLLAEGVVLALLGAGFGLPLAEAALRLLSVGGPLHIPRAAEAAVDARAAGFALALGVLTTLLFAAAPALHALRADLASALADGRSPLASGSAHRRWRGALVVAETSFAVLLASGAFLMARTLAALDRVVIGFDPRGVHALSVSLPAPAYAEPASVSGFYGRLLGEVRALPGVRHAGLVRRLPLGQAIGDGGIDVEGFTEDAAGANAEWQVVSGGTAEALGERLVSGRFLSDDDVAPGPQVAVVNEAMARTFWPGRDALGGRFRMGSLSRNRPMLTVVGVVGDVRHQGLTASVKPKFYRPVQQLHLSSGQPARDMNLVVKAGGDPAALVAAVRAIVAHLDPAVPVANVRTMEDVVASSVAAPRFAGVLLAAFAGLALALAAVGVYGVLSYVATERRPEIGVRLALGATARHIRRALLGEGARLLAAGALLGVLLALALTRLMRSLLHGVEPTDPLALAGAAGGLVLVGLLAAWLPAERAARCDPVRALRGD
jgi:predicted permease